MDLTALARLIPALLTAHAGAKSRRRRPRREAGRRHPLLLLALFASLCLLACSVDVADSVDDGARAQEQALTSAVYQIDCGGGAVSPFAADQFATGGTVFTTANAVSTAGVANAAPAAVYRSERYGNHSYTFAGLTPNASYTVRLHFAEIYFTSAGSRQFNVVVNGAQVQTNLDIFATVGANKALVQAFPTTASSNGQITIQYVSVIENAKSSGIEILSTSGGSNLAPTIATAAASSPNPVTATSATASVLGADDGGEANLTYTWATTGAPPAPVSFSVNGTNAAKSTTATFSKAGSYGLVVTVRDPGGLSVTSNVNVVVNQTLTSIGVMPLTAQVAPNGTKQFFATAKDQFGTAMGTQPAVTWAVSGGGAMSSLGVFTAGGASGGPFTVSATSSGKSGSGSVTVAAGSVSYSTSFNLLESPISEGGVWTHNDLDSAFVNTAGGLAFGTQAGTGAFNDSYAALSGFPPDQSASAVIHLDSSLSATTHEVEILLRFADGAHSARGYECNLAFDGSYTQIVRWDPGSFTYLSPPNGNATGNPGVVHDGDVFSAKIVGNVITVYLNGVQINTVTDSTYTNGNPAMGFWRGGPSIRQDDFGFTSFSATSIP